jgi:Trypsin
MDLDSGLRDCNIPFDKLKTTSPFCPKNLRYVNGRRCERYSYSQFPEVVKITITNSDQSWDLCSGTMIAGDWAITAAHCFIGQQATAEKTGGKDKDLNWTSGNSGSEFVKVVVEANNAKMLPRDQRSRIADHVVVYGRFRGAKKPGYSDPEPTFQMI